MSDMKLTPGPWILLSDETYTVRSPDGGAICQLKWLKGTTGLGGRRTDDEVMANARLIAAAPGLLYVLMAMRQTVYEQPIGVWFHAIDAAIAKATGAAKEGE